LASGSGGLDAEEGKSRKNQTNPGKTVLHHPRFPFVATACAVLSIEADSVSHG